jgi:hypothetical protein
MTKCIVLGAGKNWVHCKLKQVVKRLMSIDNYDSSSKMLLCSNTSGFGPDTDGDKSGGGELQNSTDSHIS